MQRSGPHLEEKNVRRHRHRSTFQTFVWGTSNEPPKSSQTPRDRSESGHCPGLYHALKPFFLILKVFGILPIRNVTSRTSRDISFKFLSLHTLYSIVLIVILVVILLSDFWYFVYHFDATNLRLMFRSLSFPMFLTSATLTAIFFFKLATQLPTILQEWDRVGQTLEKYVVDAEGHPVDGLKGYCLTPVMTTVVVSGLLAIAAAHNGYRTVSSCLPEDDDPDIGHYLMYHMQYCAPYVEFALGPSIPSAVLACVVVLFTSAVWNMRDILLILLSLVFYYHFKVIPSYLKRIGNQSLTSQQWTQLRNDHQAICKMVGKMDDALAPMILQSYVFNLYHISLDLFTTFT